MTYGNDNNVVQHQASVPWLGQAAILASSKTSLSIGRQLYRASPEFPISKLYNSQGALWEQ